MKILKHASLQELNKIAKRCGLFDQELFKKVEKIRELRNKIHIYSLESTDDKMFSKKDIDNTTSILINILESINKFNT